MGVGGLSGGGEVELGLSPIEGSMEQVLVGGLLCLGEYSWKSVGDGLTGKAEASV